jgi:sulfite exporter TauE/SafE
MFVFLTAVLTASLLGSMHCVGMCGPLAIFASGAGTSAPRRTVMISTMLYHLGRLTTYAIAGLIAGAIGSAVDTGGQALGFQLAAARLVGTVMIVVGVVKIVQLFASPIGTPKPLRPSLISKFLVKLRPVIFRLPPSGRAWVTGLLTTLLPCGWLYLFALIAAGTGSLLWGPMVMFAFWLGTVPALTALISGTVALSTKFKTVVPAAAAALLIFAGISTVSGRGFANLTTLSEIRSPSNFESADQANQQIDEILDTPLPCCESSVENRDPTAAPTSPGGRGDSGE